MRTRPAVLIPAVLALVTILVGAAGQALAARERWYPPAQEDVDTLYLRSGTAIRRMAGPFGALAADLYWIRAIQYYGGTLRRLEHAQYAAPPTPGDDYHELYPLLDITTTLDPYFNIAYRFGAVFLSEAFPHGAGRPDLAITLLEKGLRERPEKWEYWEDIGFVHYWHRHDFHAAAAAFDKAAAVPGAPWWLKSVAATTLAQGGDRRTSRAMWTAILQSSEVEFQRKDAERRLRQLKALDDIDALAAIVRDYMARIGAVPDDWRPIVRARGWRGVPLDPAGVPYILTGSGRVEVSRDSPLWPLPEEPEATPAR